ncbi:MAG: hypothetical protein RMY63_12920 [Nostoc sp. ChiQUE01b]|nr:hypothetical protein [Nostoc sp. ChiQUE01b]
MSKSWISIRFSGRVVLAPAKRSLPLITVVVKQNQIRLVDRKPAVDPR